MRLLTLAIFTKRITPLNKISILTIAFPNTFAIRLKKPLWK
jgi:hypothetical protein